LKREYFVLLAELQAQVGVSNNDFSKKYLGSTTEIPKARGNPFQKKGMLAVTSAEDDLRQLLRSPAKGMRDEAGNVQGEEKIALSETGLEKTSADGYTEYLGTHGSPFGPIRLYSNQETTLLTSISAAKPYNHRMAILPCL